MGKNKDRNRGRRRKKKREKQRAAAPEPSPPQEWCKVPEGAKRGRCDNPDCDLDPCVDPVVTITSLCEDDWAVVITYVSAESGMTVRFNGEDYPLVPTEDGLSEIIELGNQLSEKWGDLAAFSLLHHYAHRGSILKMSQRKLRMRITMSGARSQVLNSAGVPILDAQLKRPSQPPLH